MGTRGLYVFKVQGIYYIFYNHWDSYPSWLGESIVEELKTVDLISLRNLVLDLDVDDVWTGNDSNWLNFEGLMLAVQNVKQYKLLSITTDDPNTMTDDYDAEYVYTVDLDEAVFKVKNGADGQVTKFKLTDIPTYWKDLL